MEVLFIILLTFLTGLLFFVFLNCMFLFLNCVKFLLEVVLFNILYLFFLNLSSYFSNSSILSVNNFLLVIFIFLILVFFVSVLYSFLYSFIKFINSILLNIYENLNEHSVKFSILLVVFIILYIVYESINTSFLFSSSDNTGLDLFIFILAICLIMLFIMFLFIVFVYLLGYFLDLLSYIFGFIHLAYEFLVNKFPYESFNNGVSWVLEVLSSLVVNSWDKFLSCCSSFVCSCFNKLTCFSVFLYKYFLGYFINNLLLFFITLLEHLFIDLNIVLLLIYHVFSHPFLLLINNLFSYFLIGVYNFSGSVLYMSTLGSVEGVLYSFWLFNVKDSFMFIMKCFSSFYSLGINFTTLSALTNIIGVFLVSVCLFGSLYTFVVTIGLHMDHCIHGVLSSNDSCTDFVLCFIIFSYCFIYLSSVLFFLIGVVIMVLLFISLFLCFEYLFHSIPELFKVFQGIYSHFNWYLSGGGNGLDLSSFKSSMEHANKVFNYESLFEGNVLDIQEESLDDNDSKLDPDKFYYNKLLVNITVFLSCLFVFVMMFICYVIF